jgi:hypothetical protein
VAQIVNGGQCSSARLVIYTLEAENKRLMSQTDFSLYLHESFLFRVANQKVLVNERLRVWSRN